MPSIPLLGSDGRLSQHLNSGDIYNVPHFPHPALSQGLLDTRGLGTYLNTTAILAMNQTNALHILVTCTSTISLVTAGCAVYWFWMMRRNFRRDLVLLLIAGGSWKSLWFFVFAVTTFVQGKIESESAFCQGSGYMLQVGFEMCDFAVLFMSMHMYLQIFPPTRLTFFGHDGLYRVRRWVVGLWLSLPNLSAALAFVNPREAYLSQGGFCSLPLRPYWYRLALFWIPRYLIWIYVVFVAVSITRYVGSEFRVFGQERDSSTSQVMPSTSSVNSEAGTAEPKGLRRFSRLSGYGGTDPANDDFDNISPDNTEGTPKMKTKKISPPDSRKGSRSNSSNRLSFLQWPTEENILNPFSSSTKSAAGSRRGSRQPSNGILSDDFALPPGFDNTTHRASVASQGSHKSGVSFEAQPGLAPIVEGLPSNVRSNVPRQSANKAMRHRRRAIQRQLRLLFIYPCIYMLFWIIPFVVNCMNYFDYWAQHPIFPLRVIQISCMTLMTFADVVVFSWREKPWRHIPGSDGTFIGSFMFWRFCFNGNWAAQRRASRVPTAVPDAESGDDKANSRTGLLASLKRWSLSMRGSPRGSVAGVPANPGPAGLTRPRLGPHKRTYSGGSDRRFLEAERAAERLALERADYELNRKSLEDRRASVTSQSQKQQLPLPRREWFDSEKQGGAIEEDAHDDASHHNVKDEKRDLD